MPAVITAEKDCKSLVATSRLLLADRDPGPRTLLASVAAFLDLS